MKGSASTSRTYLLPLLFTSFLQLPAQSGPGGAPESAPDSQIQIQTRVEPTEISIGALVTIFIDVEHQPDLKVELPQDPGPLGPFEIRSIEQRPETQDDAGVTSGWSLVVATFETGKLTFPGVELTVSSPSTEPITMRSESIQLEVKSVLPEEAEDILDIRSPLEIPRAWWSYWPWAAAILVPLLLVWLFWRYRPKAAPGTSPEAPLLPPEEEALASLQSLEATDLLGRGRVKPFYTDLSEILRRYLWRRFRIVALEATTPEIVKQLSESRAAALSAPVGSILRECDLVKFARWKPPREKGGLSISEARELVEKGRPRPVSEGSPKEAVGEGGN